MDAPYGELPQACVFDAYGTLFDYASAALRCTEILGGRREPLTSLWREKQLQYTWLRSLQNRHADFWQVTGDALDYALETLGLPAALGGKLMEAYRTLDAFPEVPGVLARLKRRGILTAILSNGSPEMLHTAVANAGIGGLLDAVLSVEELPDSGLPGSGERRSVCLVPGPGQQAHLRSGDRRNLLFRADGRQARCKQLDAGIDGGSDWCFPLRYARRVLHLDRRYHRQDRRCGEGPSQCGKCGGDVHCSRRLLPRRRAGDWELECERAKARGDLPVNRRRDAPGRTVVCGHKREWGVRPRGGSDLHFWSAAAVYAGRRAGSADCRILVDAVKRR